MHREAAFASLLRTLQKSNNCFLSCQLYFLTDNLFLRASQVFGENIYVVSESAGP